MKSNNILFPITFPRSFSAEDTSSFLRHSGNVFVKVDSLSLKENSWISTDTYHNLFAKNKIFALTDYSDYKFRIIGHGNCMVEVISITKNDHYTFESFVTSVHLEDNFDTDILVDNNIQCDALYVKITAIDDTEIKEISVCANNNKPKNVKVAYCICSFNREPFVKKFVDEVASKFIGCDDIKFFISNNGPDYNIEFPNNFEVIKNRNLGGAGGFTRAMVAALDQDSFTHIILADDDIHLHKGVIDKTIYLLKGLKQEYSDHFISGSMLSLEESWLQYERNSLLTDGGFVHFGHFNDTRSKADAISNAIVMPHKGLAGWWYCVIPVKEIKEFDLPLPIFVRGDDVEYSTRCARKIISVNGICVWHEPFIKKYNEIMEDYYLCRNLVLISYLYDSSHRNLRKKFIVKKFIKNILVFDYVSAEFNLLALEHLINEVYLQDADTLHKELFAELKNKMEQIPVYNADYTGYEDRRMGKLKTLLLLILQQGFGISRGTRSTLGGFRRSIMNFTGVKEMHVYQGSQIYRIYRFDYFRSWSILIKFFKMNLVMRINNKSLKVKVLKFREEKSKLSSWREIFRRD
ncbi:Glycosyltransferase, GT2 family [Candidatus Pantoea symbiotica]|jgi:GT2 family glycosyltransferase|uniref:Glycosyltransferase, GT2 family n=1 Tax=Candidatus Pantoea symbiotica TaxID=1884370 RepID=A0A1I3WWS9_9GAMM|nr:MULTISPECIES: glycosyltransferase [Pantoea]KAJ9432543.1 glycosyltransferase [Pantoea sp. YR343]SFK11935.1 Glycosyltransferase, GT2 family [Pantoea symbiotica]SFU76001.1 Glycosyltransferase, GT2 family [Pantoea sp. YR525]